MQVRPHSYETEAMPSVYPCDAINDQQYVEQYGATLLHSILARSCQRLIDRIPRATDKVSIPSPEEAAATLLAAAGRYYVVSRHAMPQETRVALAALRHALHDPAKCITALSDALICFVHSLAVVEDGQLREAVKSAQLSLKTLQSTWAELPAVTSESWLLRGEV